MAEASMARPFWWEPPALAGGAGLQSSEKAVRLSGKGFSPGFFKAGAGAHGQSRTLCPQPRSAPSLSAFPTVKHLSRVKRTHSRRLFASLVKNLAQAIAYN